MRNFFEVLGLSILTVFAPIKPILITVLVLVMVDLYTGVYAAKKSGKPITSGGFKRTVAKLLMYEFAICLAFLVHQYLTGDLLPAEKLIASMIGLTELASVLENLNVINGQPLFNSILNRIAQVEGEPKGDRKP